MAEKQLKTVNVYNRADSLVGYYIPELKIKRTFAAQEFKQLSVEEVRSLGWMKGGKSLLQNYLIIDNEELVKELLGDVEPEYYYTKKEVIELLKHGTLGQLEDALDFAPEGVVNLIRDVAMEIEVNDYYKREAILKSTGFNITNALENLRITKSESPAVETGKVRRAEPIKPAAETPKTRVETPFKPKTEEK